MKETARHLVVVIPAYNEETTIDRVLKSLPSTRPGIAKITTLVVDDYSHDGTRKIAEAAGAQCIRHEVNLGAGAATLTGLAAARKLKADIVVTLDGDGQHDGGDLAALIEPVVRGEAEVVLGSRFKTWPKEMPLDKRIGNLILNFVTFLFSRLWVSDSQSGYKAFSSKALKEMKLRATGYEYCSEIIGEIKRRRLRFKEVPVRTIYTDYSKGKGQPSLNAINIILGLVKRNFR